MTEMAEKAQRSDSQDLRFVRNYLDGVERLRRMAVNAPGVLRATLRLRRTQRGWHVSLPPGIVLQLEGRSFVGDATFFCPGIIRSQLICHPDAELLIGSNSNLNWGLCIEAYRSVRIGDRVMTGPLVRIRDRDETHVAPVVIEDAVWIAHGAIIEPGVSIGEGSVVAAGSVVTASVPKGMLAAGNPARCMPLPGTAAAGHAR